MEKYNPQEIEKKWQDFWEKNQVFRAEDFSPKKKIYILVEFPYLSGEGLHVGHVRGYTALDVISRKKRMEGFNVLFPIGWDAFGLPTENYAVKTGIAPQKIVENNKKRFKTQLKSVGFSFDWTREIDTSDTGYYKWTQWIFVQLFKHGLAYKKKMPINWCPSCKITLANEEVIDGKCERCGAPVERREKEQWMLKITEYADRLLADLEKVDYPERVKALQRDWIGRSEGTEIKFPIIDSNLVVKVFTTRVDTIFGVTYIVLAPEHPIITQLKNKIRNLSTVERYISEAKRKLERERVAEDKEKTGVKIEGVEAINPVNGEKLPLFVADYILPYYGTGAVMAVPAHDQRDFLFAKKYNLPIKQVIKPKSGDFDISEKAFEEEGILINSGEFSGISSEEARQKIEKFLQKKGIGEHKVYYKMRDWIFSRQRYWGEPIPMIKCKKCGWVPVPESDLPVELPEIGVYKPTETGESPLAKVEDWVQVKCPVCGGPAKRETDVMPNWAGSNWYYLRYCDPQNKESMADEKKLEYWMPVDWYNGGMEHTTLHLLYSRFIYKFLWDIGAVPKSLGPEPYKKRTAHGMILAEGGVKMSKSKGNVVNPDDIVREYGAGTLRVYEMFIGPFEKAVSWDERGIRGARRLLEKIWALQEKISSQETEPELKKSLHKTIKKVSEDIDHMKFNTAVSSLMEFVNAWQESENGLSKEDFGDFLKILSPFAPHLAEEIWFKLGNNKSIFYEKWPVFDESLLEQERITLIIQINGKVRDKIEVSPDLGEEEVKELTLKREKVRKWIEGKEIKKIIFVPKKLINIVTNP